VHLFTLLTHDKFINARCAGQEFNFDENYGDWPTIRKHVEAWQAAGATFVTAREGICRVLDDNTLNPLALLDNETFVLTNTQRSAVRYSLTLLGRDIPFSAAFPHHILVSVPPSIRSTIDGVEVSQGGHLLDSEFQPRDGHFWIVLDDRSLPVDCLFLMSSPPGPSLVSLHEETTDTWIAEIESPVPHRRARVVFPWERLLPSRSRARWSVRTSGEVQPACQPEIEGLLIYNLSCLQPEENGYSATVMITASEPNNS
jgi:hypothetical protein